MIERFMWLIEWNVGLGRYTLSVAADVLKVLIPMLALILSLFTLAIACLLGVKAFMSIYVLCGLKP